jgi:hypothetical protein
MNNRKYYNRKLKRNCVEAYTARKGVQEEAKRDYKYME